MMLVKRVRFINIATQIVRTQTLNLTKICVFTYTHSNRFHLTGSAYYDILRLNDESYVHQKQTWIDNIDHSEGTFLFESTYWKRGNYLIANNDDWEDDWLYCDDNSRQNWWNVTSSVIRILQNQKGIELF